MAQLQSGDFASAVGTLTRLTESQPNAIEGWFQLARAQVAAGDTGASRDSFKRAIELDKDYKTPLVWVGLGELELRERRYQEALKVAEQIKQHYAGSVFGFDIAAAAYRGLGETEKSLQEGRAALGIEYSARRVDAYSRALAAAGRLEEAIVLLNEWLGKNPEDGARWAKLGLIEQQRGNDEAALAAYEKSLETAEPDAVLANNMAWLYLDRNPQRAVELASKAYELAPSRAEIIDTYGWVLFRTGRERDGLAALQQALVIAPRNPEIALHVAEALNQMQRDSEARPMLERVVRDHPNTDFAESARQLLGRLSG